MPRTPSRIAALAILASLSAVPSVSEAFWFPRPTLYVAPGGSGAQDGSSRSNALASVQSALDLATPGTTIELASGIYREDLITKSDGAFGAPITIRGTTEFGEASILKGAPGGSGTVVRVEHDYYTIKHVTVDGLDGSPADALNYHKKLVFARGQSPMRGPRGFVLAHSDLRNALDECVRLRYFVRHAAIYDNTIANCGMEDYVFDGTKSNGEGIYVGTAENQWKDNPTTGPDESRDIWVVNNRVSGVNSECVNIKRGTERVRVANNVCVGALDEKSGAIDVRADNNVIYGNVIAESRGAGIRLGNLDPNDVEYGQFNRVEENIIYNSQFGIKYISALQTTICGHTFDANQKDETGPYRNDYDPELPCP